MKPWLQHSALSAVVLAFLPLIELVSPAVGRAQPPPPPPCPPGMYWNFATVVCEFPPPPPVYIDPWLPVWVPDIVDADLDLDVDIPVPGPPGIGAPGRPGGIGPGGPNIGRPGPAPRPRGGVVVGVAVGDARSSGTSVRSVACQQRAAMRSESAHVHDPLTSLSAQPGGRPHRQRTALT